VRGGYDDRVAGCESPIATSAAPGLVLGQSISGKVVVLIVALLVRRRTGWRPILSRTRGRVAPLGAVAANMEDPAGGDRP